MMLIIELINLFNPTEPSVGLSLKMHSGNMDLFSSYVTGNLSRN